MKLQLKNDIKRKSQHIFLGGGFYCNAGCIDARTVDMFGHIDYCVMQNCKRKRNISETCYGMGKNDNRGQAEC